MSCRILHLSPGMQDWTKSNLRKAAFKKIEGIWPALSRPYPLKFFKGCLPHIWLGPLWNTFFHLCLLSVIRSLGHLKSSVNTCIHKIFAVIFYRFQVTLVEHQLFGNETTIFISFVQIKTILLKKSASNKWNLKAWMTSSSRVKKDRRMLLTIFLSQIRCWSSRPRTSFEQLVGI